MVLPAATCASRGSGVLRDSLSASPAPVVGRSQQARLPLCSRSRRARNGHLRARTVASAAPKDTVVDDKESAEKKEIKDLLNKPYKFGFKSDIEMDAIPKGLSEDTVRLISERKGEPEWMLDFRLKAYKKWLTMKEPEWSDNQCVPLPVRHTLGHSWAHKTRLSCRTSRTRSLV